MLTLYPGALMVRGTNRTGWMMTDDPTVTALGLIRSQDIGAQTSEQTAHIYAHFTADQPLMYQPLHYVWTPP